MTKILSFLTRPALLFYTLPWLMLLLVGGTISQRYIGLFQSEKLFFGSFILWIGIIPTPSVYAILVLLSLSLLAKLLLKSPLRKMTMGTFITHASVLVLLVGGLVTHLTREEGYIVLGDNETSHSISDYHARELVIMREGKLVKTIAVNHLHDGDEITLSPALTLHLLHYCSNCEAVEVPDASPHKQGVAAKLDIKTIPEESEDEKNRAGLAFEAGGNRYITLQGLEAQPVITQGKDTYSIFLRQTERILPFDITLKHFEKAEHPGTTIAKSYSSLVEVKDGSIHFTSLIEMNQPLRYKGYTIYQSSFVDNEDKVLSVLAIVKNAGEVFPYLAIACLCLGMGLHIAGRVKSKRTA